MGTAAYGGRGFKGRAAVSGERPIGAARCRQQHNEAPPPPPHTHTPLDDAVWGHTSGVYIGLHLCPCATPPQTLNRTGS